VASQEDSHHALHSKAQHSAEPKAVLPDGSYNTGPRPLPGLTAARFERCLVRLPAGSGAVQCASVGRAASGRC
jgi:hypothetical protein